MFGYVLPLRGELKVRELDAYRAVYCGLCHTLGRRYGFPVRMILNYDFTFLSMVLTTEGDGITVDRRRCVACPLRGREVCASSHSLEIAADESVILTYWKLRDNVRDHPFLKGLPARLLSAALRPAYRKAAAYRPSFDRAVVTSLGELQELESSACPSLDRTADTFARILSAAAPNTGDVARDRAVEQLLYHVGRWIYLVDAWDDLEEDLKCGGYNPVSARFRDGVEAHREELRTTLRHSLNLAVSACHLVNFGPWNSVLLNILCLGLPMVEEAVFTGQWRQLKKQTGRARHERSVSCIGH